MALNYTPIPLNQTPIPKKKPVIPAPYSAAPNMSLLNLTPLSAASPRPTVPTPSPTVRMAAQPSKSSAPSATVFHPTTGERKAVPIGDPNAFAGGFKLETPTSRFQPPVTPQVLPEPQQPTPQPQNAQGTQETQSGAPVKPPIPTISPETQKAYDSANQAYQESLRIGGDELATQEDLDKLIESTKKAYNNTSDQPIPLDLITGQMASIERRATGLAEPLERKLARLQAVRLSSGNASKFALEQAQKKMDEEKALYAPKTVGDNVIQYNPETGKYDTVYSQPGAEKPIEVSPGASLYSPSGTLLGTAPGKIEASPTSVQEYEYAKKQGYTGNYNQWLTDEANRKTLGTTSTTDPVVQSWVSLIQSGNSTIANVPAQYKNAVAQALNLAPGATDAGTEYQQEREARIVGSIDELMKRVSGSTVGFGSSLSFIPGTAARDFKADLETLKANISFSELQAMRNASKTGGALGQVAIRELELLESTLGALDTGQSADNFKKNLQKIKDSLGRWNSAVQSQTQGVSGQTSSGLKYTIIQEGGGFNQPGTGANAGAVEIPQSARLAFTNNNPGNLRYVGQAGATQGEGGFAKFSSPEAGWLALVNDIRGKQTGNTRTGLGPNSTLQDLVNVYAPPSENDTRLYIQQLAVQLGVTPTTPISRIDTGSLARAIAWKESNTRIG